MDAPRKFFQAAIRWNIVGAEKESAHKLAASVLCIRIYASSLGKDIYGGYVHRTGDMKIDHMKHDDGYKSEVIQIKETVFIETEFTSRQRAIMSRPETGTQDLN